VEPKTSEIRPEKPKPGMGCWSCWVKRGIEERHVDVVGQYAATEQTRAMQGDGPGFKLICVELVSEATSLDPH